MVQPSGERQYPSYPRVGVGALIRCGEQVLLVRRKFEPGKGLWSIPGGLVELGERLEEAVRREVKEETGLDVAIENLINVGEVIEADGEGRILFHYVLIDYSARPVGGRLTGSPESLEVKWVKAREISRYKTTKALQRLLKKLGYLPKEEKERWKG
ncbi:NUDIX hydrolase [Candidatus Hecatella orcuttiae]|jgi:ADP-ribose pyrophosphatase YjhB (NUDIX family)|uniref:NUDIX hydrolase n=1 Tax=Candidatus Hecatella orcuttiae TaxID=1935119 RepID=UPI002867F6B4|nr:NUDIX hydrolase [Candidatus Hecatella orcuttiae]